MANDYSGRRGDVPGRNREDQPLVHTWENNQLVYDSINEERNIYIEAPKKMKNKYRLQVYLAALIITFIGCFSVINLLLLIPRAEDFVNQSVEMDIKKVELDSITTKGINFNVEGLNVMDYSGIESSYFKNVFKVGGGLFQTATINLDTVNLTTVFDDKLIKVGNVIIPPFDLNIGNGQSTNISLKVTVSPNTKDILGLLKSFIGNPDQLFKITGASFLKIYLGKVPLGNFKVDFQQDFLGSKYMDFNGRDIKLNDLIFNEGAEGKGYNVSFAVNLPNPVKYKLFGFDIPSLEWELITKDCFNKFAIDLLDGSIHSESFKLSPLDQELNVRMSTSLDHLNPSLTEKCSLDDDATPMSILVNQLLNNKSLPVLVKNFKGSKEFPGFVNELLKTFEFNFDYLSNFDTANLIQNVSLDDLNFQFQNGDTNKPVINGHINIFIKPPFGLTGLGISKIKGVPILSHDGIEFGEIHLNEWHECTNTVLDDLLFVRFTLNQEELNITNKRVFGQVINDVLSKGSSKVFIDAILDCLLTTLLGEFELDGIHASSESDITRRFILKGFGLFDS